MPAKQYIHQLLLPSLSTALRKFCFSSLLLLVTLAMIPADRAVAQDVAGEGSRLCPSSKLFSQKLITDICWGCLFPIRMMGVSLGGGSVPDKASDKKLCVCYDNNGVPAPGMGVGYWEPARLIETVRLAGCSPTLNGTTLPGSSRRNQGGSGNSPIDTSDSGFYHYHYYAFPLLLMLDLFTPGGCMSDGMMDLDILYLSELDPTWNNSMLAFFTNPEAAAVANLPAQSACTIDAAIANTGNVNDSMWWCAGSWGSMYPFSGNMATKGFSKMTSLASTRAVAALHRRGLAQRTMGDDAMCESVIEPMLPKSQFKFNMFFPVAEAQDSHVIGESTLKWGSGRKIPGFGEDAVYMMWRWNDCCMEF